MPDTPPSCDSADANALALAARVRDAMLAGDRVTQSLGMTVTGIGPGHATVRMTVRDDMLNGHGTCHGGVIATLADSAFAFGCNATNELTVASGFSIDIMAPARAGDVLEARCTELARTARTGVYAVEIRAQDGRRVAHFMGRAFALKGRTVVPE